MNEKSIQNLENQRQVLQAKLDKQKSQLERNKLGQFSTPIILANEILKYGTSLLKDQKVCFLDPAIGTGAFYSALIQNCIQNKIQKALGFDVDPFYAKPAIDLWCETKLRIKIKDFTKELPSPEFNLVICNPPYVRHHHIDNIQKSRLQSEVLKQTGISISRLSGLYTYFAILAHGWMKKDAISGWLIPSEFMDVNYGIALKQYLLEKVTLLHIHRFDPQNVQFTDALVSSAIIWFKNSPPPKNHSVVFSYGGTLTKPKVSKSISVKALENETKWTRFPLLGIRQKNNTPRVGDFFEIKRGLATGNNAYFILSEKEIANRNLPKKVFRPILPGPKLIKNNIIESDHLGNPRIEDQQYLLDVSLTEKEIKDKYPELWDYLDVGKQGSVNKGYICSHRTPWYSQEKRDPAPIVCTYMGRSSSLDKAPFRFILNRSKAVMTNVYLGMYPTPKLLDLLNNDTNLLYRIWEMLNQISTSELLSEGRVYGGGLHKLEPKELAAIPMPFLTELEDKTSVKELDLLLESMAAE